MGHTVCVLVHIIMSLLAVVFMSILGIAVGGHANCNPLMHDCSCGDKSFDQCNEPNPAVSLHVTDLNECILNCDLFATFGQCDWLVFFNHGPDENCHLHAQGETMEEYLYTCNTVGQPTRYKDGQCMTSWEQVCKNAVFCGDGCKPCDKLDKCNKYHQTDCTLKTEYVAATELDEITMNGCTGACIAQSISNPSTYFTWDKAAEACKCYNGGTRDCVKEVVMAGFSHADVVSCRT